MPYYGDVAFWNSSFEATYWDGLNKAFGYSVRCLKDEGTSSVRERDRYIPK
ncbi:MAG: hypothetical protein LBI42_12490 [Chitinispirillales bacterium]|nr:hypothetical protein [Chitinispirillales bacterium]